MTYREAVEINTRLHGGKPVEADERFALAEYLIDRVDAGNATIRELVAMLFLAEYVGPELSELWGRHRTYLRWGV
jgi:hypothetical protein